jgi:hypothetical protein
MATVERIATSGARRACLTHYGIVEPLDAAADEVRASLAAMTAVYADARASGLTGEALLERCEAGVRRAVEEALDRCGVTPRDEALAWLGDEIRINARGIAHAARSA